MPVEPTFKPMLAGTCKDINSIKLPIMVSPKLNGIRCIIHPTMGAVTRNLKPIPNIYMREKLNKLSVSFDGELIVGKITATNVWNASDSGVMTEEGKPNFSYHIFDIAPKYSNEPYFARHGRMTRAMDKCIDRQHQYLRSIRHVVLKNIPDIKVYEETMVSIGYEGIMLRDPLGPYKYGRSTEKEGWLLKLKRVHDAEGTIVGFREKLRNDNIATTSLLGYTERSSHKANKHGAGTLGSLIVKAKFTGWTNLMDDGVTFNIGTGFNDDLRKKIWREAAKMIGRIVKFKYQSLSPDGKPIFPVFLGFRND